MSQGSQATTQPASARSVLAQKRGELALSITDVARHLKLSPAQVEALEAGAYERLPGRVFVRGFLRNYAKLLGIDPQPLLRSLEREMPQPAVVDEPPPPAEVVMPHGEKASWPLYVGLIAIVVVGALAVYEFGFNQGPADSTPADSAAAGQGRGPDSAEPAIVSPLPAEAAQADAAASGAVAVAAASAPGAAEPGERSPDAISGAGITASLPEKAARPDERELHFRFDQESWIEIRDGNDRVIFSKLNRAGTETRIAAVPPLKLVVGNARGVRLTYGDQPVDLTPHTGATVARLTLR